MTEDILEQVIGTLRADERFPMMTRLNYDLLLADLRHDIEDTLARMIRGKVDSRRAIHAIIDALKEHADDES